MNILVDGQTFMTPDINRGIGVYFKNVFNYMVKQSFIDSWYVVVSRPETLQVLDPWVLEKVHIICNEYFEPTIDYSRTEKYTEALESFIEEFNIDVYWNPNPLMVNVLFPAKNLNCHMTTTLYDLIPLIIPQGWNDSITGEYMRRIEFLRENPVTSFCISGYTKKDVEKYIGKGNHHSILLAADSGLFYKSVKKGHQHTKRYKILYTGGMNDRKNLFGALEAFALFCEKYKDVELAQLSEFILVCSLTEEERKKLDKKLKELKISDRVVLTGFVSNERLAELYQSCDLFFFPSRYEGFGLPILEAMLAGAYVLSANNSSLPEVVGNHGMFCDADDVHDMAGKLYVALQKSLNESQKAKRKRQEYALSFSWEKTARETLEIMRGAKAISEKKKIALVTPWPNQKTGIANFEFKLLPYLSKYFEIDVFIDDTIVKPDKLEKNPYGKLFSIKELDVRIEDYKKVIYEIGGNADFHVEIYKKLKKYGGIAEVHDFILLHFFNWAFYKNGEKEIYQQALVDAYGKEEGEKLFSLTKKNFASIDDKKFTMAESIVNISDKTIFHNQWSVNQLSKKENVAVIPLACFNKEQITEQEKKNSQEKIKKLLNDQNEVLIGCFGFVNINKRPYVIIDAVKQLIADGYNVKLCFFGKESEGLELNKYIKKAGLDKAVYVTGYLERSEYITGLERTDIVVNLRYPSMGESSGPLCEAFKYGKPVLVSNNNQYKEYPDEVCWKVPIDDSETVVLTAMLEQLIIDKKTRFVLGDNARKYAEKVLSPERIAGYYAELLND